MNLSFTAALNLSISASWLVLAVAALRLVLKRAPKWLHCGLWALVAVRLMVPFSFESIFSLIPSRETVPEAYLYMEGGARTIPAALRVVENPVFPEQVRLPMEMTVSSLQTRDVTLTILWLEGIGVMALYAALSYLRLRRRVSAAIRLRDNVWQCDDIPSPFILGLFRPRIYLPSGLDDTQIPYVLRHEGAHLKRRDHWWKPLGFLLLTVYWFNPVMWLAYALLCRDIELACDEKVIRQMDRGEVVRYSEALISCSLPGRYISACPVAFGEVGVKTRIQSMLNYKKPGFWVMTAAIAAVIVTAVCFMTDPPEPVTPDGLFESLTDEDVQWAQATFWQEETVHADLTPERAGELLELLRELEPEDYLDSGESERYISLMLNCGEREILLHYDGASVRFIFDSGTAGEYGTDWVVISPGISEWFEALTPLMDEAKASGSGVLTMGEAYVSERCIYRNELSSESSFGGDSGCRYIPERDSLTIEGKYGETRVIGNVSWGWAGFPWTEAEFAEFFPLGIVPLKLSEFSELLFQALSEDWFLMKADGNLLLVELRSLNKLGRCVWSIHTIVPESSKGGAQWEFTPISSAGTPGFPIRFAAEYSKVTLFCESGDLTDLRGNSGSELTLGADVPVYWMPEDSGGGAFAGGEIHFTLYQGDKPGSQGTIYIEPQERDQWTTVFRARVVGTGLYLTENGTVTDPTGPTIQELEQAHEALIPYMTDYGIATLDANEVTGMLDIELYHGNDAIYGLAGQFLELRYVNVTILPEGYQIEPVSGGG